MNSEFRSLLIKIILTVASALAVHFHSTDQLTPAIAADIADILAFAWSIYSNRAMKLVPKDSVAVKAIAGELTAKMGDHINIGDPAAMNSVIKVVGAVMFAFLVMSWVHPAFAADPLASLKNFAVADIQSALDDATSQNDAQAVLCWSALLPVVQSQQAIKLQKLGVFLALQKARDAVRTVDAIKAGTGPIGDLKNKCAAVILDTNAFLLRLGVVGAGAIVMPF